MTWVGLCWELRLGSLAAWEGSMSRLILVCPREQQGKKGMCGHFIRHKQIANYLFYFHQ
ncbi:hypothetical protein AB205_0170830 [Aquarana catesbeiana]|uniref:Uncharacterized protein n=1 Tax=Aquarana catesbeiana TaxID=8400 RepID=A0A2G9QM27_AQUCT|nr:hypothetical protein AB205_0170830 [Aquarana catesbeiana]